MKIDTIKVRAKKIECSLKRIEEVYAGEDSLRDLTKLESIILNIQRSCEATIDLAMYVCIEERYGSPINGKEACDMLYREKWIDETLCIELKKMLDFRNIATHNYETIENRVIVLIIEKKLSIFRDYIQSMTEALA